MAYLPASALPRKRYSRTLQIYVFGLILSAVNSDPRTTAPEWNSLPAKSQCESDKPVIDIDNIPASNRRAAQRATIVLDLLSLLITLGCLAFALYRSLR
jgi:hypothetical protein